MIEFGSMLLSILLNKLSGIQVMKQYNCDIFLLFKYVVGIVK